MKRKSGTEECQVQSESKKRKGVEVVNQNWNELKSKLRCNPVKQKENREYTHAATEKVELSKLPEPPNTDCSLTKVVAMDCEMVGVGSNGKKSIVARVSLVNEHENVIYDAYVKPAEFVTDFRTHVSGIRYKDIKKGKKFAEVRKEVGELLSGRILVGHALRHDFKVLLLTHPKSDMRDTSSYGPLLSEAGRPRSLKHLAALHLGANVQDGAHSSVEDARCAMMLYLKFRTDWEKSLQRKQRLKSTKR